MDWPAAGAHGVPFAAITASAVQHSSSPPKTAAGLELARRLYCERDDLRAELEASCKTPLRGWPSEEFVDYQ